MFIDFDQSIQQHVCVQFIFLFLWCLLGACQLWSLFETVCILCKVLFAHVHLLECNIIFESNAEFMEFIIRFWWIYAKLYYALIPVYIMWIAHVDCLWIIVMLLSAICTLFLMAPIHFNAKMLRWRNSTSWKAWGWLHFHLIFIFGELLLEFQNITFHSVLCDFWCQLVSRITECWTQVHSKPWNK